MINTSGQDASLLQWNMIGAGAGGGGTTGGATLPPELPPQAERQSKKEKSATALETSGHMRRSYVSRIAPGPCTGRNYHYCALLGSSIFTPGCWLIELENRFGPFLTGNYRKLVARGGPIRDKSAPPIWTPKAPRRGDERSEESTESGQRSCTRRA